MITISMTLCLLSRSVLSQHGKIDKVTKLREEMSQYDQAASVMRKNEESEEDHILKELQYIRRRIQTSYVY